MVTSIHQLNKELYSIGRATIVAHAEAALIAQTTTLSSRKSEARSEPLMHSQAARERKPRAPRKPRVRRNKKSRREPVCSECGGCKLVDLGEKDCFGRPVVYPCALCILD